MSEIDVQLKKLLERARRIAVVGASPKPDRASHQIFAYLKAAGYDVVPVNPGPRMVDGVPTVKDLEAAGPIDIVNVFRSPENVPEVVDDAIRLGSPALWLQLGVVHEEAIERAKAAGIEVIVDRCIMIDHRRLMR